MRPIKILTVGVVALLLSATRATAQVVGVPDPEWGQAVVAVLVGDVPLDEAREWVAAEQPRAWAPRRVVPVAALPLLPNGKVDRLAVERIAAGGGE